MALPAHLQIEPLATYRVRIALRVLPSLAYIALATFALSRGPQATSTSLALIALGLLAIGLAGPTALQRIRGYLELRTARDEMVRGNKQLEAGDAERAAASYDAAAHRLAGRLHANHVIAIAGAALAQAQLGHRTLALEILDQLDASGWHRAFSMRRAKSAVRLNETVTRASLGDIEGAKRALAEVRVGGLLTQINRDRAAAMVAVLAGDPDARDRIDAVLAAGGSGRSEALYLAIAAFHATRKGQNEIAEAHLEKLRALPRRDYRAVSAGWPELRAWLIENGLES